MASESSGGAELLQAAPVVGIARDNDVKSAASAAAKVDVDVDVNVPPADAGTTQIVLGSIPHDEADGRSVHDWKSRYPHEARVQIRWEAATVAAISIGSLAMVFFVWSGLFVKWTGCDVCTRHAFSRYGYFFFGGVLGGTLFGIKYLYHVVAKGFWNQDRCLWRVLSPLLAGSLAFIVGALTDAGFLGLTISASKAPAFLSLGFITGYFGDKALAKMTEMADVIFGTRDAPKPSRVTEKPDEQQ
ncbi:hypothetical protein WK75_24140 [Burkholderia ubonensis]|uniref:hypothetical protein n=1 Tax=Burkholderia ubonensis TaxID=101571 RepID=UPI000754B2A6|nr:hypothetical protein [Burkholderia ubonensis]KVU01935.1 hypothetical protein WK62_17590 [Burkholderia ubonensis]KVU87080.1 hypothetical protein WK75_24140 [Burkholderia ubonensis]